METDFSMEKNENTILTDKTPLAGVRRLLPALAAAAKIEFLKAPLGLWVVIALYGTALLVNALILSPPWLMITSDMGGYIERATWTARGIFYEPYLSFYPQGTHYLFSVFFLIFDYFTALRAVAIFQVVCIFAALYFFYRFIFDLFSSRAVAALAVVGLIIFKTTLSLSTFYLSENVYYLFMIFSLWMAYRIMFLKIKFRVWQLVLLSFVSGFTVLVRPTILIGYVLIGAFALVKQKKAFFRRQVIVFGLVAMIPAAAQSVHTSLLLNRVSFFTSASGYETFFGLSGYRAITSDSPAGRWIFTNNDWKFDPSISIERSFPYALWDDAGWFSETQKLLENDPGAVMANVFRNAVYLWKPITVWPIVWRGHSDLADCFIPYNVGAWFIYVLAALGLYMAFKKKLIQQTVMLAAPVVGLQLTTILRCGEPRYMIPFFWLLVALAAFGVVALVLKLKERRNKTPQPRSRISLPGKAIKVATYAVTAWLALCFIVPLAVWTILSRDPAPKWIAQNDTLAQVDYQALTGLPPTYVYAPHGMVKNSKLFGGPITVNGFAYENGFSSRGNADLEFALNGDLDFFECDVGMEDGADPGGAVTYFFSVDGATVYPIGRENEMLVKRHHEPPTHVKIPIKGGHRLWLKIWGDPNYSEWHNQGVWGGPVVWKE
jgi:hypothetical protein